MAKNIVILFDGTSNEVSGDRTNILRLYGALKKTDEQIVYYDPGVGTLGSANAVSYYYSKALEIWGLATGWGLDKNVKQAYRFLVENYDAGKGDGKNKSQPDRIYLFGFSRGAYTARVLAGFIHAVGLIDKVNLNLMNYTYRAYKGIGNSGKRKSDGDDKLGKNSAFSEMRLYEKMLRAHRPVIRCVGVFDTVGSVIEFGKFGPRLRSHAFTSNNKSVESMRHAVGIDERRTMFQPQLWPTGGEYWPTHFQNKDAKPQDVEEVWFSGVHSDIGGGYPEAKSQLAKIPLFWMIEETGKLGLKFKTRTINEIVLGKSPEKPYVKPDPLAARNESMNVGWSIVEFLPRRIAASSEKPRFSIFGYYIPLFEKRWIPPGAKIHNSVFERRGTDSDFEQPNIPDEHDKV